MIINIVSGKGGTGKTLLCASMAEALGESHVKALIIDMDFAVRGLTSLLYYDRGESYNIIRGKEKLSAYDLFEIEDLNEDFILGIEKYRSFDVLNRKSK
jgi:septum site-determining protein MinD